MIFKEKRFDLYWLGEIKEDGTEDAGRTVASSKTLAGIRKYAKMKKLTDWEHTINEIGGEMCGGFNLETTITEHKIQP
jgi:hypothetical protein